MPQMQPLSWLFLSLFLGCMMMLCLMLFYFLQFKIVDFKVNKKKGVGEMKKMGLWKVEF